MSRVKKSSYLLLVLSVVAGVAIGSGGLWGWMHFTDQLSEPTTTPTPTSVRSVSLWFYNPASDQDASGNFQCSASELIPVRRTIPLSNTPIQDTIRLLLESRPTSQETALGIVSEFPLAGVKLKAASLSGGVLILTFEDPDHRTGGGSCFVTILRAQVEGTAKQFPEVKFVRLMPEDLFQP